MIPPQLNISDKDLDQWEADLEKFEQERLDPSIHEEAQKAYQDWLRNTQRKVAPGFNYDIMTPTSAGHKTKENTREGSEKETSKQPEPDRSGLNEDLRTLSMN